MSIDVLPPVSSTGLAVVTPPPQFAASSLRFRFGWDRQRDRRFYLGRGALGLVIAAGHLLLLWLALVLSGFTGPPRPRDRALTAVDISKVEKPDAPAKPAKQIVVPDQPRIVLPSPLTIAAPAEASGTGSGHGCSMVAVIGKSISDSPEAMAAVAALPSSVRSDTDAVMLWNGAWLDTGLDTGLDAGLDAGRSAGQGTSKLSPLAYLPSLPALIGQDPVGTLKTVIQTAIEAAPAECLEVETLGPQLIPIAEPGHTTMLVIGSGAWRWSSLREPVMDPSALPAQPQPAGAGPAAVGPAAN